MRLVESQTFLLSGMLRLQFQHGHLAHKVLHLLTDDFQIHWTSRLPGTAMQLLQERYSTQMTVNGDIGHQHIDAL